MAKGNVLVTGSLGFTGRYLVSKLLLEGYFVWGIDRHRVSNPAWSDTFALDLSTGKTELKTLISHMLPTHVVHLAGATSLGQEPSDYLEHNILATENLLEALAARQEIDGGLKRVILVSSAQVYADIQGPRFESSRLEPHNIYGISKLAVEMLGNFWRDRGLPITVVRPFNYTGVGQSETFLIPKLVAAFATGQETLELQNITSIRDYLSVLDVVSLYLKILESEAMVYITNICSGRGFSVGQIVSELETISNWHPKIIAEGYRKSSFRFEEPLELVGSPNCLRNILGIETESFIPLEKILWDMYQEARG